MPIAPTPTAHLAFRGRWTMPKVGIGDTPKSLCVDPAKVPPVWVGTEDAISVLGTKSSMPSVNSTSATSPIVAGFHCRAPAASTGAAVLAPPKDMFVAPADG